MKWKRNNNESVLIVGDFTMHTKDVYFEQNHWIFLYVGVSYNLRLHPQIAGTPKASGTQNYSKH